MIRVLIVDGQAEVRWGMRMRLAIEPDMAVVGEADETGAALVLARALDPDLILVDIGMQGAEDVNIVKRLRAAAPTAVVVVLTLRGDEHTRVRAKEAGAQAFLEKCGEAADLPTAIRQFASCRPVARDGAATSPLASRRLGVG
jgi:DNA-binding NarL/FixJ family response regulator